MTLSIKNLDKHYGEKCIYENFKIDFDDNKVNCILGKSGCGKSTLLNLISGILKSDNTNFKKIDKKNISYIFQEDSLIPWLTIEENLQLVGKKFYKKHELKDITNKYMNLVDIETYKNMYPQKVSGGIRQRCNVARAFMKPSKYILMDEPFKSIDIKIKNDIMKKIKYILKNEMKTVVFVTHDLDEAIFLGDKIFIIGENPVKVKVVFESIKNLSKEDILKFI